jgi:hypothetical protein
MENVEAGRELPLYLELYRFLRSYAYSPGNVEDNVETPLLLRDLDSRTPLWQHDNPWIRLPAYIIQQLIWLAILKPSGSFIVEWMTFVLAKVTTGPLHGAKYIGGKAKSALDAFIDLLWRNCHPFFAVWILFSLIPLLTVLLLLVILVIICIPIPYLNPNGQCHYHKGG